MKKTVLFICLATLLGCSSDGSNSETEIPDGRDSVSLIFGWYGDYSCMGDCTSMYKLEDGMVFRDTDFAPLGNPYFEGNFERMLNADYEDFEVLITALPDEIFDAPNGCLDSTDCNDTSGGLYLEYKKGQSVHSSWRFNGLPAYMETYRSLFIDKLAEINSL